MFMSRAFIKSKNVIEETSGLKAAQVEITVI